MHLDGFITRIIFEEQKTAVINISILTPRHKVHSSGVAWKNSGRHAGFIIYTSGDNETVRVAVVKIYHDLITNAENLHVAKVLICPSARHSNPTRVCIITFGVTAPVNLGRALPFLPVCCRARTQHVLAVRTIRMLWEIDMVLPARIYNVLDSCFLGWVDAVFYYSRCSFFY